MKKLFITLCFGLLLVGSSSAQFTLLWTDGLNYPLGPVHQDRWTSWSGNPGSEDLLMVNDGPWQMDSQVGYIGNDGQDAVLKLGNQTSGSYMLTWFLSIPEDKTAYFNIQEDENPMGSGAWAVSVYFNEDGNSPGLARIYDDDQNLLATFSYPNGGVIFFRIDIHLDDDTIIFYDADGSGNVAYDGPMYSNGGNLGGINFYRLNANTEFFIDQFQFWSVSTLDTEEFSEDAFSYYPNPVSDRLTFSTDKEIDAIKVYNAQGQLLISEKPLAMSPSIDMSPLAPGTYLAKITIGESLKTIKILKAQ